MTQPAQQKAIKRHGIADQGRKLVEPHIERIVRGLIEKARGEGRESISASALLLDRLWPKPQVDATRLSYQMSLTLGGVPEIEHSMVQVVKAVGERKLGFGEAQELMKLLRDLLEVRQARAIDEIREQVEDLRRQVRGGVRVIDAQQQDIPRWGIAGRRYLEGLADQAEVVDPDASRPDD